MARRRLDFYETAAWQVDALVDHLPAAVPESLFAVEGV